MTSKDLSIVQRARIRRVGHATAAGVDDAVELNVVPFLDIVVNVMMFVLATLAVTFTASITTRPPTLRGIASEPAVAPTVLVVSDGFAVKTAAGNVAPGCAGAGAGLAVPQHDGAYDYDALGACLEALRLANPELRDGQQIHVTASPGIDYATIVHVADSVRTARDGSALFPDVSFQVPR